MLIHNVYSYCGTTKQIGKIISRIIVAEQHFTNLTDISNARADVDTVLFHTAIRGRSTYYNAMIIERTLSNVYHINAEKFKMCKQIIDEVKMYSKILDLFELSTGLGTMIPLFGSIFVSSKIAIGLTATTAIITELNKWQHNECVYFTIGECEIHYSHSREK